MGSYGRRFLSRFVAGYVALACLQGLSLAADPVQDALYAAESPAIALKLCEEGLAGPELSPLARAGSLLYAGIASEALGNFSKGLELLGEASSISPPFFSLQFYARWHLNSCLEREGKAAEALSGYKSLRDDYPQVVLSEGLDVFEEPLLPRVQQRIADLTARLASPQAALVEARRYFQVCPESASELQAAIELEANALERMDGGKELKDQFLKFVQAPIPGSGSGSEANPIDGLLPKSPSLTSDGPRDPLVAGYGLLLSGSCTEAEQRFKAAYLAAMGSKDCDRAYLAYVGMGAAAKAIRGRPRTDIERGAFAFAYGLAYTMTVPELKETAELQSRRSPESTLAARRAARRYRYDPSVVVEAIVHQIGDLARVGERARAFELAQDALATARGVSELEGRASYVMACALYGLGREAESEGKLRELLANYPDAQKCKEAAIVQYNHAKKLLETGDPSEALYEAKIAFDATPADRHRMRLSISLLSEALRRAGQDDTALRFLNFQKYGSAGPDAISGTADDLENPLAETIPKEWSEAKKSLRGAALQEISSGVQSLRRQAFALLYSGDAQAACTAMATALAAAEGQPWIRERLLADQALMRKAQAGYFSRLAEDAEMAAYVDGLLVEPYLSKGDAYVGAGRLEEACEQYKKAIDALGSGRGARDTIGRIVIALMSSGDSGETTLRRLADEKLANPEARYRVRLSIASFLLESGRAEGAMAEVQGLERENVPEDLRVEGQFAKAQALAALGDRASAMALLDALAQGKGELPARSLLVKGWILLSNHDYDAARAALEEAARADPRGEYGNKSRDLLERLPGATR